MLDMQQKLHCCEKLQKKAINFRRRRTAVELAQLGEGDSPQCGEMSRRDKGAGHPLNRGASCPNVINLKRLLNGKQNVWKYQNGEEKSDSDGREKDV